MVVLRTLLALAFAVLVVAQVAVLPTVLGRWAGEVPALAGSRWPMLGVAVLELVCVELVVVCTWRLLTMVEQDRIFSESAFAWVDAILASIATAWLLLLGAVLSFDALWALPGLAVVLLLAVVAGAVLGLLMVVMRALLRQATTLRTDMEAVI